MKLDCCQQPRFEKTGEDGRGIWMRGSNEAQGPEGKINQYAEGELMCKVDFNTKLAPSKGICVYKSTGTASTIPV